MRHFLIFAGTTEGRILAETLSDLGAHVTVSVATAYGKDLLSHRAQIGVLVNRLTVQEMTQWLERESFDTVIDATHPYATEVTQNIKAACKQTQTQHLRLLRESSALHDCIYVESVDAAVYFLNSVTGNVLLTTGSKELSRFTAVKNYKKRLYPRVLPAAESIGHCAELGFPMSHMIAMQGPFSEEMNAAMLAQVSAEYLVTKESGDIGGFDQKLSAAKKAGARVVVIGRPLQEQGKSMKEIVQELTERFGLYQQSTHNCYFPLFVNLKDRRVVVVGAGQVAQRRIHTLLHFGCAITVIAPYVSPKLTKMSRVEVVERSYRAGDCAGATLVVAATDSRAVNHLVYEECTERSIQVSVADAKAECSYYFPAIISEENVVIGVTASGENHAQARRIAENIRAFRDVLLDNEKDG